MTKPEIEKLADDWLKDNAPKVYNELGYREMIEETTEEMTLRKQLQMTLYEVNPELSKEKTDRIINSFVPWAYNLCTNKYKYDLLKSIESAKDAFKAGYLKGVEETYIKPNVIDLIKSGKLDLPR